MSPERENKAEALSPRGGSPERGRGGGEWGRGTTLINAENDRSDFGLLVAGLASCCREAGKGPGEQLETKVGRLCDAGVTTFPWGVRERLPSHSGRRCGAEAGTFGSPPLSQAGISEARPGPRWGWRRRGIGAQEKLGGRVGATGGERAMNWGSEGRGAGARRWGPGRGGSTSPRKAASQLLANQLLNCIHSRAGTKSGYLLEYLFGIVRRHTKGVSLCAGIPLFPERNNNLKLSLKSFLSIINFIFLSLSPAACVSGRVCARRQGRACACAVSVRAGVRV